MLVCGIRLLKVVLHQITMTFGPRADTRSESEGFNRSHMEPTECAPNLAVIPLHVQNTLEVINCLEGESASDEICVIYEKALRAADGRREYSGRSGDYLIRKTYLWIILFDPSDTSDLGQAGQ